MRIIMKKSIFLALLTALSTTAIANQQEQVNWPKMIESLRLITEDTNTIPLSALSPKLQKQIRRTARKNGTDVPLYKIEKLSDGAKQDYISQLFSGLYPTDREQENEKVLEEESANKKLYNQREFFLHYLQTSGHTSTNFGVIFLNNSVIPSAISNPKKHAAIVSSLADNPKLMKKLDKLLKTIKKSEDALLSIFIEQDDEEKKAIDALFIKKTNTYAIINFSPAWQDVFTGARYFNIPLKYSLTVLVGMYATSFLMGKNITDIYKEPSACAVFSSVISLSLYEDLQSQNNFRKLLNHLHIKTNSVATIIQTLDLASKDLIDIYPQFKYSSTLNTLHKKLTFSPEFNELLTLLRTNTFKENPSFFSRKGRIRAAYALIIDTKYQIVPLLMAIGELDAYLAYAKEYNEKKDRI